MAKLQKAKGDTFRAAAYTKAANALKRHPKPILSGKEARAIPGIGQGIADRIQEFLDTGKLRELEEANQGEEQAALALLLRVPGIGPVAARRLVEQVGVRSLADLRALAAEGKLRLTTQQRVGLKYFEELELRVPRAEVAEVEALVQATAAAVDPRFYVEAVGSYRRGLPESGDIDILAMHPDYARVEQGKRGADALLLELVEALRGAKLITDTIALGPVQFMGVCQLRPGLPHRRLDIKLFPAESFPTALLHFTGSWEHNRQLRIVAQDEGLLLNEYGLYEVNEDGRLGERLPVSSEEDVFRILGLPYAEPAQRSL